MSKLYSIFTGDLIEDTEAAFLELLETKHALRKFELDAIENVIKESGDTIELCSQSDIDVIEYREKLLEKCCNRLTASLKALKISKKALKD